MERAGPIWEAAGSWGVSPAVLQETYGHDYPTCCKGSCRYRQKGGMFGWS